MAVMSRLLGMLLSRVPGPPVACDAPATDEPSGPPLRPKAAGSGRLDASFVSRRQPTHADSDVRTINPRQTLIDAVQADIRAQNAEFERRARIGYVDPDTMEPWQRRRRFGRQVAIHP